jgi:hypothetical protein
MLLKCAQIDTQLVLHIVLISSCSSLYLTLFILENLRFSERFIKPKNTSVAVVHKATDEVRIVIILNHLGQRK